MEHCLSSAQGNFSLGFSLGLSDSDTSAAVPAAGQTPIAPQTRDTTSTGNGKRLVAQYISCMYVIVDIKLHGK